MSDAAKLREIAKEDGLSTDEILALIDEAEKARKETDEACDEIKPLKRETERWIELHSAACDERDAANKLLREIDEGLVGWPSLSRLRARIAAHLGKEPRP